MTDTTETIVRHIYPTFRENVRGQLTGIAASAVVVGGGLAILVGIGEVVTRVQNRRSNRSKKS